MKVFKKLQEARVRLLRAELKKSGKNKFAGFEYFELGDFIPAVTHIFNEIGLCGVVHFEPNTAVLTIYDSDSENGECIDFRSPLVYAENAKGQAIQSLGSTHTYMRRYLWLMAMEITEHDSVDAAPQESFKQQKAEVKPEVKPDTGEAKVVEPDPNHQLFVDKMIEWGTTCTTKKELMEMWKANQKDIDAVKAHDKSAFKTLQDAFAELKQNFSEE
jgi:hypothetical protein